MNERKLALNVTQLRYIQYECLYVVTVINIFFKYFDKTGHWKKEIDRYLNLLVISVRIFVHRTGL